MREVWDMVPRKRLDFDLLSPGWCGCIYRMYWNGITEEDDHKKKWEVLRMV
jgi:hypothetical protein